MLYWLSGTSTTSARLYWEIQQALHRLVPTVPVGVHDLPGRDRPGPSWRWAEAFYPELRYFNVTLQGGHFAAWEQPDLFVDEIRACFRTMR